MRSSTAPQNTAVPPLAFELPAPDITAWRVGNTGTEGVWHFDSGEPGRHVMVSALVHGNELCGAWALKGLLEAGVRPQQGTLTLAFCNLDAFDRFDASNHDASRFTDEDLNRQWLDGRIDAADTKERRRAAALRPFVAQADWLLDIHSMHEPSAALAQHLPGWRLPEAPRQWALEVTGPVVATSSAFRFVAPYTGLELFEKAGTVIGDNDGVPVTTPYDNCVLVMPSVRQARAGVTVVRFARRRAL